jgi:hypothetical protein
MVVSQTFVLAWALEQNSSWAPSLSVRRVSGDQTDVEVGVEQAKLLCHERSEEMKKDLHLIVADAKYGNHRFLGPLKEEICGVLVRMRRDRVLYGEPGPYSGKG